MQSDTHLQQIFDQLLLQVETAGFDEAILLLAGTLDGALAAGIDTARLNRLLQAHPLARFVKLRGNGTAPEEPGSTTADRLHYAVSRLSTERGQRLREKLTLSVIEEASKSGKAICLIGSPGRKVEDFLAKEPLADLHCVAEIAAAETLGRKFDRILAPALADAMTRDELQKFVGRAAALLAASGCLTLSSFAPNHLGMGWKIICEKQTVQCHRDDALAQIAAAAGLSFAQFHDASGSLAWSEMQKRQAA